MALINKHNAHRHMDELLDFVLRFAGPQDVDDVERKRVFDAMYCRFCDEDSTRRSAAFALFFYGVIDPDYFRIANQDSKKHKKFKISSMVYSRTRGSDDGTYGFFLEVKWSDGGGKEGLLSFSEWVIPDSPWFASFYRSPDDLDALADQLCSLVPYP